MIHCKVKKNNLITEHVGPASEPVVVWQILDGAHCSNCNILHVPKHYIPKFLISSNQKYISVKQQESVVSARLDSNSNLVIDESIRNTFNSAWINSINPSN